MCGISSNGDDRSGGRFFIRECKAACLVWSGWGVGSSYYRVKYCDRVL